MVFGFSMWATPNRAPVALPALGLCFPARPISALTVIHPPWAVLARSGCGAPNPYVLATQVMDAQATPDATDA